MLLTVPNVFDADKLENIRSMLEKNQFVDGSFSAGTIAKQVKNNLELKAGMQQTQYLDELIMRTLAASDDFRNAALPNQISRPVFARYESGMGYGLHIDDPLMGNEMGKFRCDVACTMFLNKPDEYEGGELAVETTFGRQLVKLNAGDIVVYPASSLHEVCAVKSGVRLVAVCWIQSFIREPAKREILYELYQAKMALNEQTAHATEGPGLSPLQRVDHAYTNLVRMWSEV